MVLPDLTGRPEAGARLQTTATASVPTSAEAVKIHDAIAPQAFDGIVFVFGEADGGGLDGPVSLEFLASQAIVRHLEADPKPVDRNLPDLSVENLVVTSTGQFFALVDLGASGPAVDTVRVTLSDGRSQIKRLRPESWSKEIEQAAQCLARDPNDIETIATLDELKQLRALAVSIIVGRRRHASASDALPDDLALIIGEAFRKNAWKHLAIRLLSQGVPHRRVNKLSSQKPLIQRVPPGYNPTEFSPAEIYGMRIDLLCDALDYNDDAARVCLEDHSVSRVSPWSDLNLGHHHLRLGRLDAADGYYLQAARGLVEQGWRPMHFQHEVFSWRPLEWCRQVVLQDGMTTPEPRWTPEIDYFGRATTGGEALVHAVAADEAYWNQWGNRFIYSTLKAGAKNVICHVHLCSPSPDTLKTLTAWSERQDCHVTFSVENLASDKFRIPYVIASRFLLMPKLMEHFALPVFVTDIDMVVTKPWSDTMAALDGADAALWFGRTWDDWIGDFYKSTDRPFDLPGAFVFAAASPIGVAYARFLARYLEAVHAELPPEREYLNWASDMTAIRRGVDLVLTPPRGAKVRNLRPIAPLRPVRMTTGWRSGLEQEPDPTPWTAPEFT